MSATVYQGNTNTPTASCLIVWDLLLFAVGVCGISACEHSAMDPEWASIVIFSCTWNLWKTERVRRTAKVTAGHMRKRKAFSVCCVNK